MASGTPVIEKVIGFFIPPACREEVLGDLRERYQNVAQYLIEAACAIQCLIYSRIRRTTDGVLALVEAASMYTMLVAAAWWLDRALLLDQWGYIRLAIPAAIILLVMILGDAYRDPLKRGLDPVRAPMLGFWLAFWVQFTIKSKPWGLPPAVFAVGVALAWLTVATFRIIFTPVPDRPQTVNYPAFWQKLELHPISSRILNRLLPGAIMVAAILYMSKR
jgi:hypothetical protein